MRVSIIYNVCKFLIVILPSLIAIAYLTLAERKFMGSMQRRRGPNIVGVGGVLQPFADAIKLLTKEPIFKENTTKFFFVAAPVLTFVLSLAGWVVIPFGLGLSCTDLELGLIYIAAISSLNVYGVIIAGWISNSKYAFVGGLRVTAQMISYELTLGFIFLNIALISHSFNLTEIVLHQTHSFWNIIPLFPLFIIYFVAELAETHRTPFDFAEAEAELVSGYNVEYTGAIFVLFFLAEYGHILLTSCVGAILFLGGWGDYAFGSGFVLGVKTAVLVCAFILVRTSYPRYRYDKLMELGWNVFLPFVLGFTVLTAGIVFMFYINTMNYLVT